MLQNKFMLRLGPGIIMASAAIGTSHLIQSTRAGVNFGLIAIFIVLAANFLRYPFYEYAHRYAAATGDNLLDGYKKLGKFYLWSFLLANVVTATGAIAAVSLVTAALVQYVLFPETSIAFIAAGILLLCWSILLIGRYKWLENSTKILMIILCVSTFAATLIGLASMDFNKSLPPLQSVFDLKSLPFLIALMGWMPASSEVSVWQSLWVQAEAKSRGHAISHKDAMFDFNIGYALIAILACLFVAIGALTLQGQVLADKPADFAGQIVSMYGQLIGSWSIPIVGAAAIATMFSTIFTLVDAYPRSLSMSIGTLFPHVMQYETKIRQGITIAVAVVAVLLIAAYSNSLRVLVDAITIIAFLAAPYFGWLNMRCIKTIENQPPRWMKILAIVGLIYMISFGLLFLFYKFS